MNFIGISVIVPIYRTEKYVEKCLKSIMKQSYRNIEIICVYREFPGDGLKEILDKLAGKDNRIILLEQRSKGLSGARNEGMQIAVGQYVYFVDSDDWLEQGALETIYQYMNQDDLDMLCFEANVICVSEKLNNKNYKYYEEHLIKKQEYFGIRTGKKFFVEMYKQKEWVPMVWVYTFKREWMMQNQFKFIENIYHEDHPYIIECFMRARKMRYIKKKLYNYYFREDSLARATRISVERLYSCIIVYQYIFEKIQQEQEREVIVYLKEHAQMFINDIIFIDSYLKMYKKGMIESENTVIDMISRSMHLEKYQMGGCQIDLQIEGWKSILEKTEKIVLYGAGNIGKMLYRYLKKKNLQDKVLAFVITESTKGNQYIEEKTILGLDEICKNLIYEDTLIIISVDPLLGTELYDNCIKRNLNKVLKLDGKIIAHIEFELEEL